MNMQQPCFLSCWAWLLLVGSAVDAKKFEIEKHVLQAGEKLLEIASLKGQGGEVTLDDLKFSSPDLASGEVVYVDALVVPVSNACLDQQTNQACNWWGQGVGVMAGNDIGVGSVFQFCCTTALAAAGKCNTAGRVATGTQYQFDGISRNVELEGARSQSLRYSWVQEDQPGNFALLVLNCNEAGKSVEIDGSVSWVSDPKPSPFTEEASGLKILSDLEKMATDCDIDTNFFSDIDQGGPGEEDHFITTVTDYLHTAAERCNDDQIEQINQAFDEFETCADGFDLQQFVEDFPSGMVGTLIECTVTTDWDQITDWNDPTELMSLELSDKCLDFEFGQNAVGHGLREFSLYPDKTMACFQEFSPKVPQCTLETYPIPIIGGLLKQATCLLGDAKDLLTDVLEIEMGVWNKCLPEVPQDGSPYPCDQEDCIYEGTLLMRGGSMALPVSDAMERVVSSTPTLKPALDKYKKYLEECTDVWDGWSAFTEMPPAPSPSLSTSGSGDGGKDGSGGISKGALSVIMLLVGVVVGAFAVKLLQSRSSIQFDDATKDLEMVESKGEEGFKDPDSYTDEKPGVV
mmetsp:Transcript_10073/g.22080  ORF Transcript_10073/g.22080 Transcript_10073/m.22080 type:complete len:573 (-) Transcript_10073:53-1771(-)